jgi:hypothetical protein
VAGGSSQPQTNFLNDRPNGRYVVLKTDARIAATKSFQSAGGAVDRDAVDQAETQIRSDSAFGPEHLCQLLQLPKRRLAEPTVLDFLKSVANPPDQQVATDPWWSPR